MTDDLELLLSAALDGTATDADLARIAADPILDRRLASLQNNAARLREMPPVDPARRNAAIAAAMSTFDATPRPEHSGAAPASEPAPVTDLASVRGRSDKQRRARRLNAMLAAAAAVVVVVAIGVGLRGQNNGGLDTARDGGDDATATAEMIEETEIVASAASETEQDESSIGGGLTQEALEDAAEAELDAASMDDSAASGAAPLEMAEEESADEMADDSMADFEDESALADADRAAVLQDLLDTCNDALLEANGPSVLVSLPDPPEALDGDLLPVEVTAPEGSVELQLLRLSTCTLEAPTP